MKYISIFVVCLLALTTAGCGGGSSSSSTGSNSVSGSGSKGPFQKGSTVTAYKLDANGARTTTTLATTVTDNLGTYTLSGIGWEGATEVVITGKYLDEATGATAGPDTLSAFIVLSSTSGGAVNSNTVNPNIASDASAKLAKDNMSASGGTLDPAAAISSASNTVLQAFGISTTDASGNAVDPARLNLLKTSDATLGSANAQLLVMSAALKATQGDAGTSSTSVNAYITSLVTDLKNGAALGTNDGGSGATLKAKIAGVNIATIAANLVNVGATVDTTTNFTAAKVTSLANAAATVVKGFALGAGGGHAINTFTIGTGAGTATKTYTIDGVTKVGNATTAGASTIAKNDVVLKAFFKDYSNTAGTGTASGTINATFSFYIKDQNGSRKIEGSLSPVKVVTDGAGNVQITVPTSAVLSFSGVDSLGAIISAGTATNVGADIIQATNSTLTINANTLLTKIQNKVGNTALNVLNTAGTFDFQFGLGLNVGFDNGGTGMTRLYKTGEAASGTGASAIPASKVSGRRIYGVIHTI